MKKKSKFSEKVRWIFLTTTLTFAFWGIVDPIYSIYVSEIFGGNYFLMGVAFCIRSIMSLLAVFFFARLLQKMPGSQGLFIAHTFSILVALLFFFAGYFESSIFIFIAAIISGFVVMLRQTSKQTMLMEESNQKNSSSILGTNVALKYSMWGVGMFTGGLFFGKNISMEFIYLFLAFLLLLKIFIFRKYFKEFISFPFSKVKKEVKIVVVEDKIFLHLLKKMKKFKSPLNFSIVLFFFMEMTTKVVILFIPLLAKEMNLEIWQIFVLMAFMMLPMLFTFFFSTLADKKDRFTMIIVGILLSLFPLSFLIITTQTLYIAIASSFISLCLAIMQPAVLGISAAIAPKEEKKSVAELELFFATLGAVVGSLGIGAISQIFGIQKAFALITIMAAIFLIAALWIRWHIIQHHGADKHNEENHHHRKIFEHTHFHWRRHLS